MLRSWTANGCYYCVRTNFFNEDAKVSSRRVLALLFRIQIPVAQWKYMLMGYSKKPATASTRLRLRCCYCQHLRARNSLATLVTLIRHVDLPNFHEQKSKKKKKKSFPLFFYFVLCTQGNPWFSFTSTHSTHMLPRTQIRLMTETCIQFVHSPQKWDLHSGTAQCRTLRLHSVMPQGRPNFWAKSYTLDIVIRWNFIVGCLDWSREYTAVKLNHRAVVEFLHDLPLQKGRGHKSQ